jgi:hypothetical protein
MGSTARRRGVYGGEYAPTGLRLFEWWKKNGERRLQKPGSGFAGIRSHEPRPSYLLLYRRDLEQKIGQIPNLITRAVPGGAKTIDDRSTEQLLVHVIRTWAGSAMVHRPRLMGQSPAGQCQPPGASEAPARGASAPGTGRLDAIESEPGCPGRCATFF